MKDQEKYHSERREYIGGSDIAAVMGLSRWTTPLQLWGEKRGIIQPKDLSGNEAVELGTELEDFVAKKFERKTGKVVRRAPKVYVHKEAPFARCQVDRLITNQHGYDSDSELLECKTASLRKEKEWEGEEIPTEYILQVQWQLGITGRDAGWIACLIGGQKFVYKRIQADKELFNKMLESACAFMKMVQDNTPPMAILGDDSALLALHPTSNQIISIVEEMNTAIKHMKELEMHIYQMQEEVDLTKTKLKEVIGDNLGIKTSEYQVTWKPQTGSRLDMDRIREDGLYDKYVVTKETRVMRITKNKEKQ